MKLKWTLWLWSIEVETCRGRAAK